MKLALITAIALALPLSAHAFERDKKLHAIAGGAIYAGARVAGVKRGHALGACVAAGIAKEAYDATGRGQVEAMDAVATALPCVIAYMIEGASKPRANRQHGTYTVQRLSRDTIDLSRPVR